MAIKMTIDGVQFADGSLQENSSSIRGEVEFYNTNLVNNGPLQTGSHVGGSGTWTVPENTEVITMHVWGGGGSGSGHCCHGCLCDMQTCAAQSGLYARKTLRKCDGDFNEGDIYSWCYGAGGNGDSDGAGGICYTVCCDAPRGCASYVTGPGLINFCAAGGYGGYQQYCATQSPLNQACRQSHLCDLGMQPGIGNNTDFAHQGSEPEWHKERVHCDCGHRWSKTTNSYGLDNAHGFFLANSRTCCGMTNCIKGPHLIAAGGASQMKSWCGNYICCCNGTPGNPGMVKIEWS